MIFGRLGVFLGRLGVGTTKPGVASAQLVITNLNVFDNASVGDTVGTLSVVHGSGSYTFTLTNDASGKYSITGSSLKVAGSLTAGTDAIVVHADNGSGGTLDQGFNVTVIHASSYIPTYYFLGF